MDILEERISVTISKGFGFKEEELKPNEFSGGWKMRAELAKNIVNQPDILLLDEPTNQKYYQFKAFCKKSYLKSLMESLFLFLMIDYFLTCQKNT